MLTMNSTESDINKDSIQETIPVISTDKRSFLDQLKDEGHKCIRIDSSNDDVMWCGETPCKEVRRVVEQYFRRLPKEVTFEQKLKMMNKNLEQKAFATKLKEEGHQCVRIRESYPIQVSWCRKTICKYSNIETRLISDEQQELDSNKK